ncbi:MAG: hypothetical protein P8Z37_10725 [Acidobacteriota bacterium]
MAKKASSEKSKLRWVLLLSSISIILLVAALLYSLSVISQVTDSLMPVVDASIEVRFHITAGHLWFEEVHSGDASKDIAIVWENFDQANWYLDAMQNGGENEHGVFEAVDDEQLVRKIDEIRTDLKSLIALTEMRLKNNNGSRMDSYNDQQYESLFDGIISKSNELEDLAKSYIDERVQTCRYIQSAFIAGTILFWIFITVRCVQFIYLLEQDKRLLGNSNQRLKEANTELALQEEKFRKANLQMIESEQRLGVINEKLQKSESKFRGLFDEMNEGACLHRVIYDSSNKAVDYEILDINKAYEKITGITLDIALGDVASSLYGTGEPPYLDIYARVAETGVPTVFETYFPPMEKYFSISVFSPEKGLFATIFTDISDRVKSGQNS